MRTGIPGGKITTCKKSALGRICAILSDIIASYAITCLFVSLKTTHLNKFLVAIFIRAGWLLEIVNSSIHTFAQVDVNAVKISA